jgi:signal transduction histidine kinase/ligand-binding sensor domain-containing protein
VRAEVNPIRREWTSLEQYIGVLPTRIAFWFKSWQVLCLFVPPTLFFLIAAVPVFAQEHTLEVSQYLHTSWTAEEGFFRAGIESVTQTSDGYLWAATPTGSLLRFDGIRFSEWKPPGNDSLPKPLFHLLGSKDGSLWIAGIGLAELKANGEFRRYHQLDGTWITGGLIEDKDGEIWAGGAGPPQSPKLCRLNHGESECFPADSFLGSQVGALHEDRKGQLLVCTTTGVWRLRPGPPEKVALMPAKLILDSAFEEDANGTLVFAAGDDMKTVTGDGNVTRYPIAIVEAHALLKDRDRDLWFGTDQGVIHLHEGRIDRFNNLDGLSSNEVRCIFQDREGNLWVGTESGLDKFYKPAVPKMTSKQGLSHDFVTSVLSDREGVPWVGTDGGLFRFDNGRLVKSKMKVLKEYICSLFETSKGRMLVATGDSHGLMWVDGDKVSRLRVASGENVFGVAEGDRGDLWVASRELGLLHLNPNGKIIETFDGKILGKFSIIALAYDPGRDGLWLTSPIGDLGFFKSGKFLEQYGTADGLGEGNLRDPQVDKDGGVWVSTRVGLAHLSSGKISVLSRKNGLPCDGVHWMRHDRDHNVWLYTECGLVAFSETELSSWIAQPSHTIAIAHYLDNTDGVANVAISGWYTPLVAITADGRILFAGTGLSILDPSNLNQNSLPPPVHIEEVTADGREFGGSARVSLPARAHSVQIAFTALSFAAPRKVRFRYKLQGYDKDWSSPALLRQATYTNLPPGNYEFRVMACNNDGVWNTAGDTLNFFIPPAFYQSLWFKALVAITFAALLWSFYLLRLKRATADVQKRLLAQMEERERIARELHDTLLQGFQGVTLRVQGVAKNIPNHDPLRKNLDDVLDGADEVLREARHRVRDLRRRTTDENELPARLTKCGQELSKDHTATFTLAVVGEPKVLESTVQDEAYRIAAEALTNAFRHASASKIETEVTYDSSALRIRVRDDGVGIDKAVLSNGQPGHWGLTGMRERAHAIRAELKLWSRESAGTEVELVIPAAIAYPRDQRKPVESEPFRV